jgi:hypothetical protein
VTDIAALEEVWDQTRLSKPPNRTGSFAFGRGISPAFERAKVSRDPKPVQEAAKPIELPKPSNAVLSADASNAEIRSYDDLISALRARADQLLISREVLSELAALPDRYANKVLSLNSVRRIGMTSLGPLLRALSLKLVAVSDDEALARNRAHYVKRDQPHTISAKKRHSKPWKIRGEITATFCD